MVIVRINSHSHFIDPDDTISKCEHKSESKSNSGSESEYTPGITARTGVLHQTDVDTNTDTSTNSNADADTHVNANSNANSSASASGSDDVTSPHTTSGVGSEYEYTHQISSALARFRRLLSDLVESHGVDELVLRWTDCDRCQLEIIGRTIPTNRITDLIADTRYQTRLVALLTTRRQPGFQLDAGTIASVETTNCDGTEQSPDVRLNGECDDVPSNEARFSEPILNSSDVDPSMSPSPMATVATLSFDRDFIAPESILLFGDTNA
jgi:hypothetical protein